MGNTNYIDIAVFLILIIEFFVGMRNGIILLVSDIISIIAGWFAAKAFSLNFALFLDRQFGLVQKFSAGLGNIVHIPEELSKLPATIQNLSEVFTKLNLPDFLRNFISKDFLTSSLSVQSYIDMKLATLLLNSIAFIAIFLVAVLIIRIVGLIIRRAIKVSPFLNWIDILFGGLFKVILVAVVLAIVAQAIVYGFSFFNVTQNSFLGEILNSRFYALSVNILPQLATSISKIISGIH
jgi:hypothetical protein